MPSNIKRAVKFLEITVASEDPALIGVDAYKLTNLLRKAAKKQFRVRRAREDAGKAIKVCDSYWFVHKNVKHVALLFSFADREGISATYEDIHSGALEHHPKGDTKGSRTEAHLVIRLKPSRRSGRLYYKAALEVTSHLSPSTIGQRLRGPLRAAGTTRLKDSSGEPVKTGPMIVVDGLVSENLLEVMTSGKAQNFDLIQSDFAGSAGIDEEPELAVRERQVSFKLIGDGFLSRTWDYLRQKAKDENFNKIRIRYTDSQGVSRTTNITDFDKDALHQFIARGTVLTLKEPMDYNHVTVVQDFAVKLAAALLK
jgi:hypothetical protein